MCTLQNVPLFVICVNNFRDIFVYFQAYRIFSKFNYRDIFQFGVLSCLLPGIRDTGNRPPLNKPLYNRVFRPLAGYGLPPPRANFEDHIFLEAKCLARILQHVSPLAMAVLSCNSLLHTLPYKIFD